MYKQELVNNLVRKCKEENLDPSFNLAEIGEVVEHHMDTEEVTVDTLDEYVEDPVENSLAQNIITSLQEDYTKSSINRTLKSAITMGLIEAVQEKLVSEESQRVAMNRSVGLPDDWEPEDDDFDEGMDDD